MKLTSGLVGAEAKGPVGWLIWDNPSKLNALSPGMYEDAFSVIEDYAADPAIKVVIMRGAGRKAFISGADIKSFEKTRANAETTRLARETTAELRHKLLDLEKPLIDDLRLLPRRRARHGAEPRFALRVVRRALRHPGGGARRRIRAGRAEVAG
jgi:Enoyl-CoA hydratase/isomerase